MAARLCVTWPRPAGLPLHAYFGHSFFSLTDHAVAALASSRPQTSLLSCCAPSSFSSPDLCLCRSPSPMLQVLPQVYFRGTFPNLSYIRAILHFSFLALLLTQCVISCFCVCLVIYPYELCEGKIHPVFVYHCTPSARQS